MLSWKHMSDGEEVEDEEEKRKRIESEQQIEKLKRHQLEARNYTFRDNMAELKLDHKWVTRSFPDLHNFGPSSFISFHSLSFTLVANLFRFSLSSSVPLLFALTTLIINHDAIINSAFIRDKYKFYLFWDLSNPNDSFRLVLLSCSLKNRIGLHFFLSTRRNSAL